MYTYNKNKVENKQKQRTLKQTKDAYDEKKKHVKPFLEPHIVLAGVKAFLKAEQLHMSNVDFVHVGMQGDRLM